MAWTITGTEGNLISTIGGRAALEVLVETLQGLPAEVRDRAARNLLVGLAMDEYKDELSRGDYLIRNLIGADQESGSLAVNAPTRAGQTVQFHMRDAAVADQELTHMLLAARRELTAAPAGAVLCSCNGRGPGLFGTPNHDVKAVQEQFGALPVAGFFCNGEIGPVGRKNFLHGFTASIAAA